MNADQAAEPLGTDYAAEFGRGEVGDTAFTRRDDATAPARGRGRPRIGPVLPVRIPADLRDQLRAAAQPLEAEADTARRLLTLGAQLADPADIARIVGALRAAAEASRRKAAGRPLIGDQFADARAFQRREADQAEQLAERLAAHLPTWLLGAADAAASWDEPLPGERTAP